MMMMMMMVLWLVVSPAIIMACPNEGSKCRDCIAKQMKCECPACSPLLQCVARCLWAGTSKPVCVKRCDCAHSKPKLSDCKKCISKCKCSCMVS